jgi:hypothetical protein
MNAQERAEIRIATLKEAADFCRAFDRDRPQSAVRIDRQSARILANGLDSARAKAQHDLRVGPERPT